MLRSSLLTSCGVLFFAASRISAANGPDFNGDGFDDLAIGCPMDEPNPKDTWGRGSVHVMYGSASGITAADDQRWTQDSPGIPDTGEHEDRFGTSLAWGDFNGDDFDDLAIGVLEDTDTSYGAVHILFGSSNGLTADGDQFLSVDGTTLYAARLAVADFNGDDYADLAVSANHPTLGPSTGTGLVHVLYGSDAGLSSDNEQFWHQDVAGLEGDPNDSEFWWVPEAGDFNGDGFGDLAVASPDGVVNGISAGKVHVIYGSPAGLSVTGNQLFHQDTPGISNAPEDDDGFGRHMASGDFNGDDVDDLAIAAPFEDDSTRSNHGVVHVLYGTVDGLGVNGTQAWDQGKPGVQGSRNALEVFGSSLTAGDFNGDGAEDLAVGVPREFVDGKEDAGVVNVLFGSPAGLTANDDRLLKQNQPEATDRFGAAITCGDYNGDGRDDLAIGAPFDSFIGSGDGTGIVNIFMGRSGTSGFKAPQTWHRNKPGIVGQASLGHGFGYEL